MALSKPNLVWGKRSTVDAEATNVLASLKPGAFESSTNHKAYNLELGGKRVLIQSPVVHIPWGASSEMKDANGKVTEQKKVSFKVELDTSVPEQASFKQFLEQFDDATKATILANYPKMTRAKDENASEDQKKMAIDFNFKYPTIKVTEDKQGNARKPAFKANILSRAARDGKDKPDIKDPANWLINVYKISDEGELEKAEPSMLTERGLTAKITFELRVTNSQMGYTTALTARSVVILDQSSTNDAAAMAAWADDEDVQEFKKRKLAAKGASPPQAEAPAYDADAADDY